MEPPKPQRYHALNSAADPQRQAEIDEYERLLAERFQEDPSLLRPDGEAAFVAHNRADARERRLKELRARLFGGDNPGP